MPRSCKLFPRYRRPSLGTLLGITQVKRSVSRKLGLATLRDPTTPLKNLERRELRKVGYYSEPMKAARAFGFLKPGGCGLVLVIGLLFVATAFLALMF